MSGFTVDEKIAEIERASVSAAWLAPDSVVIEREGWHQIITPSSRQEWLNGVLRATMSEAEASQRVAEVIESYRRLGSAFRWRVGPLDRPAGLGKILEASGMKPTAGLGMVADPFALALDPTPGVIVERVSPGNLDEYVEACLAGWSTPRHAGPEIRRGMERALADAAGPTRYYLARVDGEAAGTAVLRPFERSGYLMGTSVVPWHRGKGAYRALVARRLADLRALDIRLVTIQAIRATSAPLCARMGFETVCEMHYYEWSPGAAPGN